MIWFQLYQCVKNYINNSLLGSILRFVDDEELAVTVRQLEIHEERLRVDTSDKIGSGEFGVVYKGLLSVDDTWSSVAVKVIKGKNYSTVYYPDLSDCSTDLSPLCILNGGWCDLKETKITSDLYIDSPVISI